MLGESLDYARAHGSRSSECTCRTVRIRFLELAKRQEVSGQLRRAQGKRRGKLLADDGEVVFFPLDGCASAVRSVS